MSDFVTAPSIGAVFRELTQALEKSPQTDFDDFAQRLFSHFGKDPKKDKASRRLAEELAAGIQARGIFSEVDNGQPSSSTATAPPPTVPAAEQITSRALQTPVVTSTTATPTGDAEAQPGPRAAKQLVPFQPGQITNWKKALLLGATIVNYAFSTAITAGAWNEVRNLADQPLRNPEGGLNLARIGTEAGAGAVAALLYPALLKSLPALQAKLVGIGAFSGEVGKIMSFLRWVLTSAIGGSGLYAGVKTGLHASETYSEGEHFDEWMFAGYFVAFMILISGNFIGARLSGQHVSFSRSEQSWLDTGKTIGEAFFNDFASVMVWVNQRIPNFIVWFAYEFYAVHMGPTEAALWGTLAIFVASYKVVVEMIGGNLIKAPQEEEEGGNEGGMRLGPVQQ